MKKPILYPVPATLRFGTGVCDLRDRKWVLVPAGSSDTFKRHARDFASAIAGAFAHGIETASGTPSAGRPFVTLSPDPEIGAEAHAIAVTPRGITLSAGGEAGFFYGLGTIRQLVDQCGGLIPAMTIQDRPDFANRGVMLDVSRCKVPTMESLYSYIDRLALLRINQLQLYIEHTFAFAAHEAVWHDASPFTAAEIQAIDAYCRDRYIQLVPNLNSFGHVERWLRHPEYRHLAECPDGFDYPWGGKSTHGSTLKPCKESLEFLDGLYAEYLPNFTSPYFNIGCDETWELGKGASKADCEKRGTTRVYMDFLTQIHRLAKRHGRTAMFWGDIILHEPKLIPELPKGIIAKVWGYEATHPFEKNCPEFAKAGVPFYVCPGTSSWGALVGRTTNALGNLANSAEHGLKNGAIGYLITDWGDGGHHQYLPTSWMGIAAGAAYSWSFKANKSADVAAGLDRLIFKDAAGVTGQLFADMGRVQDLGKWNPCNSSPFHQMANFDMASEPAWLKEVPAAVLTKYEKRFLQLRDMIPQARPAACDGELVKAEAANGIALALHGIHRVQAYRNPRMNRTPLRHELQDIIMQHEELWLARNRRGGLRESSGNLIWRLNALQ